jgi:hypothetical protein
MMSKDDITTPPMATCHRKNSVHCSTTVFKEIDQKQIPLNFVFSSIWHCKLIFLRNSDMNSMVNNVNPHYRLIRAVNFPKHEDSKKEAKEFCTYLTTGSDFNPES